MSKYLNIKPLMPLLLLLSTLFIAFSCANPPNYPDTPVIGYLGVNQTSVYQGIQGLESDTLELFISFTDGDGDLSFQDSSDIFLYDSRIPTIARLARIPFIPEEGTGNGIRGELTIRTLSDNGGICCIANGISCSTDNPTDTFSYEIQIRDRAGNYSNKVRTETITILCQ